MLSLWGHLRRLLVLPGIFLPRTLGAIAVGCHVIALFGSQPGSWRSLPVPRVGHGTPGFSFWPPRSALACLLPGWGRQSEGERSWGARPCPLQPRGLWQGTQLLRDLLLCPRHFSCIFLHQKEGAWERNEKSVSCPRPSFGAWGDRSTLRFLSPSNFTSSLVTHFLSSSIYGERPSRGVALKGS